jgi:phospholipase C
MRAIVRKSVLRSVLLVGAAAAAAIPLSGFGCSSPDGGSSDTSSPGAASPGETSQPLQNVGSIGMDLSLPGGEQLTTVTWSLTGPNGAATVVQSGSVNVQNSQSLSFVVGGIPAGSGYAIALSGTSTDGASTCTGSAQFSVGVRTTTSVAVQMQCATAAAEAGSVLVSGNTFNCATWNSVTAVPSETTVGNAVAVAASAIAPNAAALTYSWSAPSGTFDTPNAASAHFTCTAPGPVTLTVAMGDGPVGDGGACSTSLDTTTLQVTCDGHLDAAQKFATATKIKHLVVIFGENVSYDHYFATYPSAQNNPGETPFAPAPGTPASNSLAAPLDPTHAFAPLAGVNLLTSNPNAANAGNGTGAANPFRLNASQAATADQGHNYLPEQEAYDNGAMDLFPKYTGTAGPPPDAGAVALTKGLVMAYYDGNTLNTLWNLAQSYALNDNSWTTNFGPSTPGAINLISGQTNGIATTNHLPLSSSHAVADGTGGLTLIGDTDPLGDVCSSAADQNNFAGKNVGDLLNAKAVSWGWFEGGFDLTLTNANGTTACNRSTGATVNGATSTSTDYIPHHAPFQYYPTTANPTHARPSAVAAVGTTDVANHGYDSHDFFDALNAGNLPAVVYLKAPAYEDGHPGYSDPVDEQNFVAQVVAALQASQEWSSTAIVVNYDDSDGWYDHQASPIVNPSSTASDALNGVGFCTSGAQQNGAAPTTPLLGVQPADGGVPVPVQGRCGYGTRVPMMVISPYAKRNFIDHTLTDQTSILKFVEDNWLGGQRVQPGGSFDTIANSIQNMLSGI